MAAKKSAPKAAPKTLKPAAAKAELPPKVQNAPRAGKPAATGSSRLSPAASSSSDSVSISPPSALIS